MIVCDGEVACGPADFAASAGGCNNRNCVVLTDRSDDDNSLGLAASGFDEYDISVGFGSCGTCCLKLNSLDDDSNAFLVNGCFLGCSGSACGGSNDNFRASCIVGQSFLSESAVAFNPPTPAGVGSTLLSEFICDGGSLVSANADGEDLAIALGVTGSVLGVAGLALFAQRRRQRAAKSGGESQPQAPREMRRRLEPRPPSTRPSSAYLERIKRSSVKSIFRPSSTYLKKAETNRQKAKFGEVEDIDDEI